MTFLEKEERLLKLEQENYLLRGTVVDSNTNIDAYLEVKLENEYLNQRIRRLVKQKRKLEKKLYNIRKESSLMYKILNLFSDTKE